MLSTYLIGAGIVLGLVALWVAVQSAWHKSFLPPDDSQDVLALRRNCGTGCGCLTECKLEMYERKQQNATGAETPGSPGPLSVTGNNGANRGDTQNRATK